MTLTTLLAAIIAALLVQLGVGIGIAVWRRSRVADDAWSGESRARAGGVSAMSATSASRPTRARAAPGGSIAWPGWREFRVARREYADAARTQCSFVLEPVDGDALAPYRPGQYLTFGLCLPGLGAQSPGAPGAGLDESARTITRCYSLSDRPDPRHYRVTIKRVPAPAGRTDLPPGVSSNWFHDHVQEGDVLDVKAPSGHFVIDPGGTVPVVLIAGGIGITPLLGMLLWCRAEQPQRVVHLYYGVHGGDVHAFKEPLERLARDWAGLRLNVAYSRPGANDVAGRDFQHAGHVDIALLQRTLPPGLHGQAQFYVCGPAPMMASLVRDLAVWGVPETSIHSEAFGPASARAAPAEPAAAERGVAAGPQVRFERSGRTLSWEGRDETLLEFAERHGVLVESGCRAGGCGTCETALLEGSVRYARVPDHDIAAGHALLCVGVPASDVTLDA